MHAETGSPLPRPFLRAAEAMVAHAWRPEMRVDRVPGPQRLAPHAAALTADLAVDHHQVASGRLVLLHDPDGNPAWDGTFRCVVYIRATVEPEMAEDPLMTGVGWSWLIESLENHHCEFTAASGTVTVVHSESFGTMENDAATSEIEIRASWTPLLDDGEGMEQNLEAWSDLLGAAAGLPPVPPGVVLLPRRTR